MSYFLFDFYSLNDSNNNIQFYMDNIQDESYYKKIVCIINIIQSKLNHI